MARDDEANADRANAEGAWNALHDVASSASIAMRIASIVFVVSVFFFCCAVRRPISDEAVCREVAENSQLQM